MSSPMKYAIALLLATCLGSWCLADEAPSYGYKDNYKQPAASYHPTPAYNKAAEYRRLDYKVAGYQAPAVTAYEADEYKQSSSYKAPEHKDNSYKVPTAAHGKDHRYKAPAPYKATEHRGEYQQSASSYKDENHYDHPAKYDFKYEVKDDKYYNDFGHAEYRDADRTDGSYHVLLPDGRIQYVKYYVNGKSGFVAEVTYSGEAKYDNYKAAPSYKAESYKADANKAARAYKADSYSPAPYKADAGYKKDSYKPGPAYQKDTYKAEHQKADSYEPEPAYQSASSAYAGKDSSYKSGTTDYRAPSYSAPPHQAPSYQKKAAY